MPKIGSVEKGTFRGKGGVESALFVKMAVWRGQCENF